MSLARAGVFAGYFGLLGLWVVWSLCMSEVSPAWSLLASTLPLLPWLRGLLYARRGAHLGAAMSSLLYFIHAVGAYTDPATRLPALMEIACSLMLFSSVTVFLRTAAP